MTARKVLVTGGMRSGKSRHAERLLAGEPHVTYVAPGPVPDPVADPEWAARIATHQSRRPDHWVTVETRKIAAVLRDSAPPIMIDCLGTWLTATIDHLGTWDQPLRRVVGRPSTTSSPSFWTPGGAATAWWSR